MKDNVIATALFVLLLRYGMLIRYPWIPSRLSWLIATLPVLCVSYAWLAVEHPDQARQVRSPFVRLIRLIVDILRSTNRYTSRLGSTDGGYDTPVDAWQDVRQQRKNARHERATDPRPSATLRAEQQTWEQWGCPGRVISYDRHDMEGRRLWVVALPDDVTVRTIMPKVKDMVSRGAKVPSGRVGVGEGNHAGELIVVIQREELQPLPDQIDNPVLHMSKGDLSVSNGIPAGLTYEGPWSVRLADGNHSFVGAATNQGKSVYLTNVLAAVALMNDAEAWLIDPKKVDYAPWKNVVARYAAPRVARDGKGDVMKDGDGNPVFTDEDIVRLVADLKSIMQVRLDLLAERGWRKWKASHDEPQIVAIIDEVAELSGNVQGHLADIARLGRAAGIKLVIATQKPTATNINTTLNTQLIERVGFHCLNEQNLSFVLGDYAGDEFGDKPNRNVLRRPGDAIIVGQSEMFVGRTYYLTDGQIEEFIARLGGAPRPAPANHGEPGVPMGNEAPIGAQMGTMGDLGTFVVPPAALAGFSERQIRMWTVISERGPISQVKLGEVLGVDRRTFRPELHELERAGLIANRGGTGGGYVVSDIEVA